MDSLFAPGSTQTTGSEPLRSTVNSVLLNQRSEPHHLNCPRGVRLETFETEELEKALPFDKDEGTNDIALLLERGELPSSELERLESLGIGSSAVRNQNYHTPRLIEPSDSLRRLWLYGPGVRFLGRSVAVGRGCSMFTQRGSTGLRFKPDLLVVLVLNPTHSLLRGGARGLIRRAMASGCSQPEVVSAGLLADIWKPRAGPRPSLLS